MALTSANYQLIFQKILKKHGVEWMPSKSWTRKFLAIGGFSYKKPGGNPLTWKSRVSQETNEMMASLAFEGDEPLTESFDFSRPSLIRG
eukprot:3238416-Amphidinium_carterae.1